MSDGSEKTIYSVDTNVLMDWQARYYPTDVFSSLVGKMDDLISEGRLLAPELVEEELNAVGTTELTAWATARPHILSLWQMFWLRHCPFRDDSLD
jgi:uncharacterized protein DUF4411